LLAFTTKEGASLFQAFTLEYVRQMKMNGLTWPVLGLPIPISLEELTPTIRGVRPDTVYMSAPLYGLL
jgi:hypothetical protein